MNRRRGSALLELALSASSLVALLAGGVQFGYTFHIYGQLQTALRNGARYASTIGYSDACRERITEHIQNVVVYGSPDAGGASPVILGLVPTQVSVDFKKDSNQVILSVRGLTIDSLFSSYSFDGKPLVAAPLLGTGGCE